MIMKNSLMNKRQKRTAVTVLCSVMLTFSVTYTVMKSYYYRNYKEYKLLAEAEYIVNKNFYYSASDKDKLIDSAVSGYISGLDDKYSRYQSIEQTEERKDSHAGLKVGIGVTVSWNEEGFIEVYEVGKDSPAGKAGVQEGDRITALDSVSVKDMGYDKSIEYIKNGEENSIIVLTVERGGEKTDISVKREKIEVITASGEMIDDNTGYISITQFNDKTPEQMKKSFNELVSSGAEGIIFDLRNNGGGLVTSVEGCLDPLIPEGDIAVAVYKDGREEVIVTSDKTETDIPMVVLINENSASGAELFAASLRDFKDTELVGVTSYGKGIMQDTFTLSNGSTVILTVAEYKTTRSECYHGVGLVPDFEVKNEGTDEDLQMKKAVEILKKKMN